MSLFDSDDEDILNDSKLEVKPNREILYAMATLRIADDRESFTIIHITQKQLIVLNYFNTSSERELSVIVGVSTKKAKSIIECIPIADFNKLVTFILNSTRIMFE